MVIKPKVRGFICVTAHPDGCAAHVQRQIDVVRGRGPIANGPKKVLVLGASTGYGLASRIVSAFGCGADTLGVFYERPAARGKTASAGWYNVVAFEEKARAAGLQAASINGDAFSEEIKQQVIDRIGSDFGQVDLVIYSLAAPRRTDPNTGQTHKSVLKPVGQTFTAKNLDTDRKAIEEVSIEPADEQEIADTIAVMGGDDWALWIDALETAGVLADGATSIAYSYIGPEVTWPVYRDGTIGLAKKDLYATAHKLDARLKEKRGRAFVSVNKAVVSQASSAIPVVPLYLSLLFKIMKARGLHEDCIEQIDRLFRTQAYGDGFLDFDDEGRVRLDDWEMREEIQAAVRELWPRVTSENLDELSDFAGYQENFLNLFGFEMDGVDYKADTEIERDLPQ